METIRRCGERFGAGVRRVFLADHVSNRLVLKGSLGAEKARLLNEIRVALDHPDQARLRPLWQRDL